MTTQPTNAQNHSAQDLATFAKKKGFIYPSSDIYGGLAGFYDYGHLGTMLKHNFQNAWRQFFLSLNQNFYEIETANIMHQNVFKASGHLDNFVDPIVHCSSESCDWNARADHLLEEHTSNRAEDLSNEELTQEIKNANLKCPTCQSELQDVETMNMMFPLKLGVGSKTTGYLRPETAQSPYVNFKAQYELQRKRLPLGLALIGRAYRNEISPRNLTLRQREFTQAELQIFFNPNLIEEHPNWDEIKDVKILTVLTTDRSKDQSKQTVVERTAAELNEKHDLPKFYIYHLAKIQEFYLNILQIPKTHLRFYQLNDQEKAFYNKFHFDIEANLHTHNWTEIGGLHYRTDHDLKGHQKISKTKMELFDEQSKQRFIPHVLELSFGVDRNVYSLLDLNYVKDNKEAKESRGNDVLNLPINVTPFTAAVLPLVKNKEHITNKAKEVLKLLKQHQINVFYDEVSSIGRRYARADEAGIKFAITIDFDTLATVEDDKTDIKLKDTVTVRNRDTTMQERVNIKDLVAYLQK